MPEIEIHNLGPIPPRTKMEFLFDSREPIEDGTVIDGSTLEKEYTCVDCGYHTTDVAEMQDHQQHQKKYHSLWQRWKRYWS